MQPIPILLADAEVLIRLGLKYILEKEPAFELIGEAANDEELTEVLLEQAPNIVILDYNQPGNFGLETISIVKSHCPGANILVISSDNEKKNIFQVLEYGIHSFLTKTCGEEEIVDAIKATAKGEKFFCTKIIDYLLEKSFSGDARNCAPSPLSSREVEIVQLIAKGLIAKEIAGILNLSTHTIYTHRKNIMRKLNLSTSSELILYAVNNGIVESGQ